MSDRILVRRARHLPPLLIAGLALSLLLTGCAALPEDKSSTYQGGYASLSEDSAFYAGLLASIEPQGPGRPSRDKIVLLAPTFDSVREAANHETGLEPNARDYFARGLILEAQALADVLRRRRLAEAVVYQEVPDPPQTALTLAKAETAVVYLDLRERQWFYLPANGEQTHRLGLDLYLIHNREEVRAWLARLEEYLARPALAKPAPPAPAPPPVKSAKRAGKSPAGLELRPAAFGLSWRASLATLRAHKITLGPTRRVGELVECLVKSAPELPENTESLVISLHPRYGLQQIVWRSKPITGDPFGFLGREQFLNFQDLLEGKYGPASASEKFLDPKQFKARDQFYPCLEQAACGSWNSSWKLNGMFMRLALQPAGADQGILSLTYQGPEWNAILVEREREQRQKLEKAL